MKRKVRIKKRQPTGKKTTFAYQLATVLSRVLDPFVTVGGVSTLAVFRSGLSGWPLFLFLFGIVFATILLFAALLHWAIRKGHISNWDLTNRKERIIPLFVVFGVLILDVVNARFFINDFLVDLFVLYIFWIIGFFLVTVFWKISGHVAGATLAVGLLLAWYGQVYWPVSIIIPLVGWARIIRKDHTIFQEVAGFVYSVAILSFFSNLAHFA